VFPIKKEWKVLNNPFFSKAKSSDYLDSGINVAQSVSCESDAFLG
jgi:hypothetical protein